jgi:hypothetical protein
MGDQQGMYLALGKIYTRVQDYIDCRKQLRHLTLHPNLKYDIDHTLEQVPTNTTRPNASSSKTPPPPQPTP